MKCCRCRHRHRLHGQLLAQGWRLHCLVLQPHAALRQLSWSRQRGPRLQVARRHLHSKLSLLCHRTVGDWRPASLEGAVTRHHYLLAVKLSCLLAARRGLKRKMPAQVPRRTRPRKETLLQPPLAEVRRPRLDAPAVAC